MHKQSAMLTLVVVQALMKVEAERFEFLTPELFFYYGVLNNSLIKSVWASHNIDCKKFRRELKPHIDSLERVPKDVDYKVMPSMRFVQMTLNASNLARQLDKSEIGLFEAVMAALFIPEPNIIRDIYDSISDLDVDKLAEETYDAIFREEAVTDKIFEQYKNSFRKEFLQKKRTKKDAGTMESEPGSEVLDDFGRMFSGYDGLKSDGGGDESGGDEGTGNNGGFGGGVGLPDGVIELNLNLGGIGGFVVQPGGGSRDRQQQQQQGEPEWKAYVKELTAMPADMFTRQPLIGREDELERTIHVLSKLDRHNVLYVGEPGVGKTAMFYGLMGLLKKSASRKKLPPAIAQAKVFSIDPAALVAGSQFRGDFENRVKSVMEGISKYESAIIYIDDLHDIVGLGSNGNDTADAASMMVPYMDIPNVRFVGTTGFKEYNQRIMRNKNLSRRFETIEIREPDTDHAVKILEGIMPFYESFHLVKFKQREKLARYTVELSRKYITNRFLPEKALDLIDESGAFRKLHPLDVDPEAKNSAQWVDKSVIAEMVKKVCHLTSLPDIDDDSESDKLSNLAENIKAKIFGQDQAVKQVVEAILMAKAGLLDEQKPIASFLFVGQTGVGKTEIVKVLAKELDVPLVRFDMSEYTERHTVAKLIGSPAGYVGYDDGGLLTDAIRKTPNCVLLLDEIEKAHSDIYNVLLQIMDYANLTDNKGQKADFRHVILVMTSNAGAQYAHQATVGFNGATAGSAMLSAVKKTFKPEFINRLSATVLFNDIDEAMASRILDKKLDELRDRLKNKDVTLSLTSAAMKQLLDKGFSPQYGAREIDRVLNSTLSPIIMREILFGGLKKGGEATVDCIDGEIKLSKIKATKKSAKS